MERDNGRQRGAGRRAEIRGQREAEGTLKEGCRGQGMWVWRGRWWPPTPPGPGRHLWGRSWTIQGPRREKPQACI